MTRPPTLAAKPLPAAVGPYRLMDGLLRLFAQYLRAGLHWSGDLVSNSGGLGQITLDRFSVRALKTDNGSHPTILFVVLMLSRQSKTLQHVGSTLSFRGTIGENHRMNISVDYLQTPWAHRWHLN
jgi:hypothetical protein